MNEGVGCRTYALFNAKFNRNEAVQLFCLVLTINIYLWYEANWSCRPAKYHSNHSLVAGQLGNTGIIVLNTCDQGECDCTEILGNQKESRDQSNKTF